ncbi:hypothetical protein [Nocardia wallacei]|uniref:hypothetical protein n=1 Tax=Nocardia wallacei TaxID=480035 RepID=UPI0024578285|nr:hypothetical protein [Nocardia wallacei]
MEIHKEIRERVVSRSRRMSPDAAVDHVLADAAATEKLLRVLAYKMRREPPAEGPALDRHNRLKPLLYHLWQAWHEASGAEPTAPPGAVVERAERYRQAVELVLATPRSTRDVLRGLTVLARDGVLATAPHSGTPDAVRDLYDALIASGTLPPEGKPSW